MILIASILIWALSYYPRHVKYSQDYQALTAQVSAQTNVSDSVKAIHIQEFKLKKEAERQEQSYIGSIGHFIETGIKTFGFRLENWGKYYNGVGCQRDCGKHDGYFISGGRWCR